eukprot:CAMPEP_0171081894 /NCGR_PEP_ID=MMETSP0766_2-20121228/16783_1 /TAXON_ID=439317 /ORGANISM="Gambierdiscus australes, Strain CAWD 149" /LENGTH=132 /DNA_ID=CAMNT_0011539227 /DNA_START=21 /DNA_END=419 /DNA_ORIENTATION=-
MPSALGALLPAHPLCSLHGAALRTRKRQPQGVHLIKVRIKEGRVALRQGQQRLFCEERCLAIELLPHVTQGEVGVPRQRINLLRGCLQLGKGAMPPEHVHDLLRRHGWKAGWRMRVGLHRLFGRPPSGGAGA